MTSAFIIQVQPELQSDPNEETAALLRVLIHKIDNTTFGNDIPVVPQWSGPPHRIIQVQAILYASLAASLLSAFLAMLGKQWLNRYASIDMRGSAIERSQNRQRKLDGVVAWYFDYVMESLPLMLQLALLLLGSALSCYLWEVNATVTLVVLGVTAFGVASYAFFVVAGTASASCPYQTPGARILRHLPPLILSALRSVSSRSEVVKFLIEWHRNLVGGTSCSIGSIILSFVIVLTFPIYLVVYLALDAFFLARATVRVCVANVLRGRDQIHRVRGGDSQTVKWDLQCVLWMLRTSLDKTTRLLTLRLLGLMTMPAKFDPALVSACLDILTSCISIVDGKMAILQGSEDLVEKSALCYLRTLTHLTTVDPTSGVFQDMRRRYAKTFPMETDLRGLPYYHLRIIHHLSHPSHKYINLPDLTGRYVRRPRIQWDGYKPPTAEHPVLIQLARLEYQRKQPHKVPRWILSFGRHILSQDPLPPTSAVAGWLSIIAMDLGCAVVNAETLDERCVRIWHITTILTKS